MPKINLLYIITKLELGGAQKQLLSLIGSLDREKYNIFLFAARDGLLVGEASSINGLVFKRSDFLERPVNPLRDALAFFEIYSFIRKNGIQAVHTHSSKAGILGRFAARAARVPVIIHTVHGWSFHDYQPGPLRYFYILLERICALFTSRIITVSFFDKKKGLKSSIGKDGQYVIIKYGIDAERFRLSQGRKEARAALRIGDNELAIGMIACFKPQKSPADFIKIADGIRKRIPDTKFIMVGDGVLRKRLSALIKKLGLNDRFILTGWRQDIPLILSALDIFVLTSSWEGLPITVLEAMAAGVPVVATDTGGVREAIESGKTGYLAKAGDRQSLQNRIEELLMDRRKRSEFIRLSSERINSGSFSLEKMCRETEKLYSDLWGGRQGA
ncbi:MAG: glycosyltransferase family 4 protein [Candidatus Omnitrophica bacterium]|nr:glycosyltransferase family 4 protein [Candidatus Omnitrophota bacterium]MDD5771164.1 glycosyltransferase family 4 protein [Candidatus Omnitrophota bacterium]